MALAFCQKILCERESAIAPALDSDLEPGGNELRLGYSTMKGQFTVKVRDPLPWNNRAKVRWPQCSGVPLGHGQIGHAHQADASRAPGLGCCPFDEVVIVLRVQWAKHTRLPF